MIKTLFLCAVLIVTMASARQAQAASTQVVVSVSWQIQDGRRQAFQAIAQEMVELAGKEPGTLGFEWYMSADGKRCQLIETYEDADALVTHLLGPVLKVGAPKLLTMSSISGVQVYGEPGAKAREILAQFKPKIFSHTLGLNAGDFTLRSPDFANGKAMGDAQVSNSFGCSGRNISPSLSWNNPPDGTKSFALMVHDPDAPTGSGWWHWVIYDIPADVRSLASDAGNPEKNLLPATAVQGRNDMGLRGYGGPCPPAGNPHNYYFRLYALKVAKLDVAPDATAALVGFFVNANMLGKAELIGLYGR